MVRGLAATIGAALLATALSGPVSSQSQRPQIATSKVEGTDNVYIFRNGGHQSMFIVTKEGVIATDPIAYGRPTGGQTYVDEIKKVAPNVPIKYLIYSHHHFDHIAGGKAFKDAGARVIAHKNVLARLKPLKDPNTVLPDEVFDGKKVIQLGGTTLELIYLGLNHSDSNIVMRLPKEKIIFVVDTLPVGAFPGRGMIDFYPMETEGFIKQVLALDWERLIPGHPGQPNDRLGTKEDVKTVLAIYQEASEEMRKLGQEGKCWDKAEEEFKLTKYENMPGYKAGLPFVARRYCGLWGRGT
jgi:glyoxylase-like metal-dependent hydrolase (beta-lactamase superfamily II)